MKPFLVCATLVMLALTPLNLAAQNIQDLLARIESLEKRLADMEGRSAPAAAPQVTPPATPEAHAVTAVEGTNQPEYPSLHIAGFSDINFSATDQRGVRSGFNQGQFTLHVVSALSPRVTYFGEVTLAARADAGTGTPAAVGFNPELERNIIRFDQSDKLKVSFGRYHTPINYWNTAFHHGQWLQTTVSRPEMTQFGGRFIPVHFVGALVEGAIPSAGMNLNYNFGIGNGRSSVISRGSDAGDVNNHRAWLANVFIKPDAVYGLQVGASVYRDKINTGGREFPEWITSAHLVWNRENPEIIAEAANINHTEVSRPGSKWNSQAYYIQAAYRLPDVAKLWKPYYRFEYIHIPRTDAVFQGVPNLAGSVAGLRYDISTFAAIKFEYRNQRRQAGQPRINGGFIQTSFTF